MALSIVSTEILFSVWFLAAAVLVGCSPVSVNLREGIFEAEELGVRNAGLYRRVSENLYEGYQGEDDGGTVTVGEYEYQLKSELGYLQPVLMRRRLGSGHVFSEALNLNVLLGSKWEPRNFKIDLLRPEVSGNYIAVVFSSLELKNTLLIWDIGHKVWINPKLDGVANVVWGFNSDQLYVVRFHNGQQSILDAVQLKNLNIRRIFSAKEPDSSIFVEPLLDGKRLALRIEENISNSIMLLNPQRSNDLETIYASQKNTRATLRHTKDCLYLLEGTNSHNGRLSKSCNKIKNQNFKTIIEYSKDSLPLDFVIHDKTMAVVQRTKGIEKLTFLDLLGNQIDSYKSDCDTPHFELLANLQHLNDWIRVKEECPIRPERILKYSTSRRGIEVEDPQPSNTLSIEGELKTELKWVKNEDVEVPMTLIYNQNYAGPRVILLSLYGAYGVTHLPKYSPKYMPLLEKGGVLATCHIRGGGFLGSEWHMSGVRANKPIGITDIHACHSYLTKHFSSQISSFAVVARSAGALALAAFIVKNPSLLNKVILEYPFIDVVSSLKNPKSPLNARDRFEWGDPSNDSEWTALKSWAPFENFKPAEYPSSLVIASKSDNLVGHKDALAWIDRVTRYNTGVSPQYFLLDDASDHDGPVNLADVVTQQALENVFLLTPNAN